MLASHEQFQAALKKQQYLRRLVWERLQEFRSSLDAHQVCIAELRKEAENAIRKSHRCLWEADQVATPAWQAKIP